MIDPSALLDRLARRGLFRIKPGLERVQSVLATLGNPQEQLKTVHIAGTNGKGSVCAMLESVLRTAGFKTGLYTSPHLWDVRERIQIGRRPIGVAKFWEYAQAVLDAEQRGGVALTYFEFLTVMAFVAFEKEHVEVAVIEAGMGGRWDATNVLTHPQLTVITSIGLDHMEWLGRTETAIAKEKAGILKTGVPMICGAKGKPAQVIAQSAKRISAPFFQIGNDFKAEAEGVDWTLARQTLRYNNLSKVASRYTAGLLGPHQIENTALVLAGLDVLSRAGWKISTAAVRKGLSDTHWAGRFQWVPAGEMPAVLFDGAHNPAAMQRFLKTLQTSPWKHVAKTFVFSAYKDKDYRSMLRLIKPHAARLIVCTMPGSRSLSAKLSARVLGKKLSRSVSDPHEALHTALQTTHKNDLVIVTGSLALVGMLMEDIQSDRPADPLAPISFLPFIETAPTHV